MRSIGLVDDIIYNKYHNVKQKPEFIVDEVCMMGMFDTLGNQNHKFGWSEICFKPIVNKRTIISFRQRQYYNGKTHGQNWEITTDLIIEEFNHKKATHWYLSEL